MKYVIPECFIFEKGILGGIWRAAIGCWESLRIQCQKSVHPDPKAKVTHLSRYIIIEMTGVGRIMKLRAKGRLYAMNVIPINTSEPRVCLCRFRCIDQVTVYTVTWSLTFIKRAPSTLRFRIPKVRGPIPCLARVEAERTTDDASCDPRRFSGSHISDCMRLTASADTRGEDGKLRWFCQFRIICRV